MAHPFRERAAASLRRVWGSFGSSTGLGADARYTPAGGGAAIDIRVMPIVQDTVIDDVFSGRTRQTGRRFEILTHDAPARPQKGDTIALLDAAGVVTETFTLTEPAVSEDRFRIVWRCLTGEPA